MDIDQVPRITCEELKRLMDERQKVIVVDLRSSSASVEGHIKGAIKLCYDSSGDPDGKDK